MAVVLYPGAFKPPHKGHFELVKGLLKGSVQARIYSLDNQHDAADQLLKGKGEKIDSINRVIIFIGSSVRNGINQDDSRAVWDIYKKHLPGNVDVIVADANPMLAARKLAKENPGEKFYAVTGIRSSEDYIDLRRVSTFKGLENVQGLAVSGGGNSDVRATSFRNAILYGSLDNVLDFFPNELSREEILKIVEMLKQGIIAEMMAEKISDIYSGWFNNDIVSEGSSGTPLLNIGVISSEERTTLENKFKEIRATLEDDFDVEFNKDRIVITLKGSRSPYGDLDKPYDFTPHMASILEYMIDSGITITPLPEVKIKRDIKEAEDFFGKTAYYNPSDMEIVLYTANRHPKDVMRSFAHEMIHHVQNIEGRLGPRGTTDTNTDTELEKLEEEAYLRGNMIFRKWEDSQKKEK